MHSLVLRSNSNCVSRDMVCSEFQNQASKSVSHFKYEDTVRLCWRVRKATVCLAAKRTHRTPDMPELLLPSIFMQL